MKAVKKAKKGEARTKSAAEYLRLPYSRFVVPDEDAYRAEILEFPGCIAVGDTDVEALQSLSEVAINWIEAALEMGQEIPQPMENPDGYSGKLVLRMPRSLHRKAAFVAQREGVSLNQFIVNSLAEQIGGKAAKPREIHTTIHIIETSSQRLSRTFSGSLEHSGWQAEQITFGKDKSYA
jgi:predicted HicB family RNase H-like nuclease